MVRLSVSFVLLVLMYIGVKCAFYILMQPSDVAFLLGGLLFVFTLWAFGRSMMFVWR